MNIAEIFIRRPVATILLMLGLFLFGIIGYRSLPISDLPNVDFPTIQVNASLPGASPETMASAVATPLERQFSTIAGIDSMTSTSNLGQTQITLQFNLDRNIDAAAQDVQSAIAAASRTLPADLATPPTFMKVNPAAAPILFIALTSSTLPLSKVDEYAETFLAQRISMVNGVAQVNVLGAQKYAVRVQLNPDTLAAYNIGLDDVSQAIQNGNVNLPTGSLNNKHQTFLIQASGQLMNAADYRSLIVTYRNGSPIHLQELGQVMDSVQNDKAASWYDGKRGIVLAIQRQPGTNTIAVVDAIKKLLPVFKQELPSGVHVAIFYDRSQSIRHAVNEVQFTLVLAAVLVILVIFLFLRNLAATFIASVALPLSIIATFAMMHLLHFNLDNLSLLALTLVVGFVVDDAIVMLENIYRYKEQGLSAVEAAIRGSKEICFTIISMTLSLMIVFVPILFMGGILGRLMHELAITICIAILFSGIISLTLTPMLCSRLLQTSASTTNPEKISTFNQIFSQIEQYYATTLQWALQHRRLMFRLFLATILLTAILFAMVSKGFLPNEDTGQVSGFTEADSNVSFTAMANRQQQVAQIISKDPNVASVVSSLGSGTGGGNAQATNAGRLFIRLQPFNKRHLDADAVIQELRHKVSSIPGINVFLQNIPSISMGRLTKSTYQFTLQDVNSSELQHWANIFQEKITKISGVQDVTSDLQWTGPQIFIKIDRNKASALGISAAQIEDTLANAYSQRQVSSIYTPTDDFPVILELEPRAQTDINTLAHLYIHATNGKLVPLATIATLTHATGPAAVNHQGQLTAVTISFNLKLGHSLGTVVSAIQQISTQLHPPATLIAGFQGTAQAFQSSINGLGMLVVMAILAMYIVLGILYESFIHPLTILSGLPAAIAGALLALLLFHVDLNFYAFIGIIMLIGIVKKNAIMMIDFALEAQRHDHKSPLDAIHQACLIRFRPIMMTTMAAIMGTLPIALAIGSGAASRQPLGIAVVGGLLFSQFLTLYITPVIYLYFEALREKIKLWLPRIIPAQGKTR